MTEKQIFSKKQYGDIKQVANMLGVSRHNATQLLRRKNARRHKEAVKALKQIIADREKRILRNANN